MSETDLPASPPPAEPAPVPVQSPSHRPRRLLPVLAALLFLVLFAALGWHWTEQQRPPQAPDPFAALAHRLDALEQQFASLQQRPAPAPPPAPVDLAPLEARLAALEQRPPPAAPAAPDAGKLAADLDRATGTLAALETRLAAAEQQQRQLGARAAAAQLLAQAQVALDAGAPLGDIAGAPPALARFAHDKPPTDMTLRRSFPEAAAAAARASRPASAGKTFGERVWLRVRALVTVRQGDRVLVGTPAAEVLGEAQARLDAGDLAGTLAALDQLDGPAAQAMAAWRGQAQALQDARAALAQMARG